MFTQNWVYLYPKNGGIEGVAWKHNWLHGLKKNLWGKMGPRNKKACSDSMWLEKQTAQYLEPKNTPDITENQI